MTASVTMTAPSVTSSRQPSTNTFPALWFVRKDISNAIKSDPKRAVSGKA